MTCHAQLQRFVYHAPSFTDAAPGWAICLVCRKPITREEFLHEPCPGDISVERQ